MRLVITLCLLAITQASFSAEYRINVGGPEWTDPQGNVWAANDAYADWQGSARPATHVGEIANTENDTLFHTSVWDGSRWVTDGTASDPVLSIPVDNGTYTVAIWNLEQHDPNSVNGGRVFDILLEGQLAVSAWDIYKEVGMWAAVAKYPTTTVTDGVLDVQITNPAANAGTISALHIYPVSDEEVTLTIAYPVMSAGRLKPDPNILLNEWLESAVMALQKVIEDAPVIPGSTNAMLNRVADLQDQVNNLVAIEVGPLPMSRLATAFDSNTPHETAQWVPTDEGAMQAVASSTRRLGTAARLDYKVYLDKPGAYYVWLKGKGFSTGKNSVFVGMDNGQEKYSPQFATNGDWSWRQYSFTALTSGLHTINIWSREADTIIGELDISDKEDYRP